MRHDVEADVDEGDPNRRQSLTTQNEQPPHTSTRHPPATRRTDHSRKSQSEDYMGMQNGGKKLKT